MPFGKHPAFNRGVPPEWYGRSFLLGGNGLECFAVYDLHWGMDDRMDQRLYPVDIPRLRPIRSPARFFAGHTGRGVLCGSDRRRSGSGDGTLAPGPDCMADGVLHRIAWLDDPAVLYPVHAR